MDAYFGKMLKNAWTEQADLPKIQVGAVINAPMVKGSGITAVRISNKAKLITKSFVGCKIQRCLYTMTQIIILPSKAIAVMTPKTDACAMSTFSAFILSKVYLLAVQYIRFVLVLTAVAKCFSTEHCKEL